MIMVNFSILLNVLIIKNHANDIVIWHCYQF